MRGRTPLGQDADGNSYHWFDLPYDHDAPVGLLGSRLYVEGPPQQPSTQQQQQEQAADKQQQQPQFADKEQQQQQLEGVQVKAEGVKQQAPDAADAGGDAASAAADKAHGKPPLPPARCVTPPSPPAVNADSTSGLPKQTLDMPLAFPMSPRAHRQMYTMTNVQPLLWASHVHCHAAFGGTQHWVCFACDGVLYDAALPPWSSPSVSISRPSCAGLRPVLALLVMLAQLATAPLPLTAPYSSSSRSR
jgi:hypothetical protein